MKRATTADTGPLGGVRVLDLSAYIAGPYGCTLLADLGAEVIKIEPPEGDNLRKYPSTMVDHSRAFVGVNRGKRGVVINLKNPNGLELFRRMTEQADVVVHNFRPSVAPRLGIDYPRLSERNPRLIYCSLSGYGDRGPLRDRAGYDQVLQSMTGICAAQGSLQEPQIVFGSVVDYYAAALLALQVSAALVERERTERGSEISMSLLHAALAMQSARLVWADGEPRDLARDMRSGGITGIHPTANGHIYLSANTPHFWQSLCRTTGLHDLADDPRYASVRQRAQHADELIPKLRAALMKYDAATWEHQFGDEVPCARVRGIEDMFEFEQVQALGAIKTFSGSVGSYRALASALGRTTHGDVRPAPGFGEHTREVLTEHGLSNDEIDALGISGALATPPSSPV
ncbi:MAG: CoA transferase [Betaproteobacteria bacterium]|nr:CoA transferase [Betaproteobacteria bacterium]